MAINISPPDKITMNDINIELGKASGAPITLNDSDVRSLTAASGYVIDPNPNTPIEIGDFYGASSVVDPLISPSSMSFTNNAPTNVTSGCTINKTTGDITQAVAGGTGTANSTVFGNGTNVDTSLYDIRLLKNNGASITSSLGLAENVWYDFNSTATLEWYVQSTNLFISQTFNGTLEMRLKSSGAIITSASLSITADATNN